MSTSQLELHLEPQKGLTLTEAVRRVMQEADWITPYQVQRAVEQLTGTWHSDSSVTARIRELRAEFGYEVERRKMDGARSFQYRLVKAL